MGSGPVRKEPALKPADGVTAPQPAPPRRRRWKRWVILLVVLSALWLGRAPLLTTMGRYLDVSAPPTAADFVMVLGGDHNYRPVVAAALYKAGLAHQVLVPTVHQGPDVLADLSPPEEEVIRGVLTARGVPERDILLLNSDVDSTEDEATALARFLNDRPGISVTVVTTDYHTRRARWIFERRCGARASALHFASAPANGFDASDWWRSERGFTTYLNEYAKLAVYWVRG